MESTLKLEITENKNMSINYMPRLLKPITNAYNRLTKREKTKIKQSLGIRLDKQLISLARNMGIDVGVREKTQFKRAYNAGIDYYNEYIQNINDEILKEREERKRKRKEFDKEQKIYTRIYNKTFTIIQIKNRFEYNKNKFHITDYAFKFSDQIRSLIHSVKIDSAKIFNKAIITMYNKLMSMTDSTTWFRVMIAGFDVNGGYTYKAGSNLKSYGGFSFEEFNNILSNLDMYDGVNPLNLEYTIQIRKIPNGGGMLPDEKIPKFLKKRGITIIHNDDELCGQRCLVLADAKNENAFKDLKKPKNVKNWTRKANLLGDEIGVKERMSFIDFDKYADKRNKQVIILSELFQVIYETEQTRKDKIYLYYDSKIQHYHYIQNVNSATNDICRNSKWCYSCNKSFRFDTGAYAKHKCVEKTCYFCKEEFETVELKNKHFENPCWLNCRRCNCLCPSSTCRDKHETICKSDKKRCPKCKRYIHADQYDKHVCGEEYCSVCETYHTDKNHRCWIKPLHQTDRNSEIGEIWAYDFESKFDKNNKHIVNYCIAYELFGDGVFVCKTINEFVKWVLTKKNITFVAHNGKAYDTWLVHKYLINETNSRPNKLILAGNKIMYMKIKSIRFIDSLNHIAQSLAVFPSMFGVPELKKGFFPYLFNIDKNQNYVGKIPDVEYYNPDEMKPDKRKEFYEWYDTQKDLVFDFEKELHEYCASDVDILKKSLEIYIKDGIKLTGINPLSCTTIASYAMKVFRTNFLTEGKISVLKKDEYDFCKRGFYGGRTEVFKRYEKISNKDIEDGKYINYIDIKSLYPTVQFYDKLPCGLPVWEYEPIITDMQKYLENHFGYLEVDVKCPNIHIPLLPEKKNFKLMFDNQPKNKCVYSSVELLRAIEIGYKITKVYRSLSFDKCDDLFKGYIRTFFKIKEESNGYDGDDIDGHILRTYNETGVMLEKDKIKKNKGMKLLAKILLNSLWGKFGQKDDLPSTEYITEPNKWFKLLKQNVDGKIMLKSETMIDENTVYVQYINKDTDKSSLNTTNVGLAGMVTAQARLRLYKELHKLNDRVIYCDTDSIVYKHDDSKYNTQLSDALGGWEAETKNPIIEFVGVSPKTYAYKCSDGKIDVKCKGVTLHYNNLQEVNLNSLKNMVFDDDKIIKTDKMEFIKDSKIGAITTRNMIKEISCKKSTFKRVVNNDYTTTAITVN